MYQVSLQFDSVADISRFLKAAGLKRFLLLGKKSVLVARFSETAMRVAKENFQAEVVDNPEFRHLAKIYFGQPVALCE